MTALRVLLGLLLTCGAAADTFFDLMETNTPQMLLIFGWSQEMAPEMTAVAGGTLFEGPGPVTLFGVTNEVLTEMQGVLAVADMLALGSAVLEFHIVPGMYDSTTLAGMVGQQLETLRGFVTVVSSDGPAGLALMDDRGRRVDISASADIITDNGVMHILEDMLWPPVMYENHPDKFMAHDAVDGYTPVPATATLSDVKMCTGYTSFSASLSTRSQCHASCDSSASCMGFSWGVRPAEVQPGDRRRTLLAHDDEVGNCYLITTAITTSSVDSGFIQAGCYKKGDEVTPPASHDYTPVPDTATLSDVRMCTGYTSHAHGLHLSAYIRTLSQCRDSCDSSASCMGFSWGFSSWYDELRDYLEMYDDEVGLCYPITTAIATSSYDSGLMQAGCYKKDDEPSVDKDNRNGIMRAAVAGDTTSLAVALADPMQNIDLMDNTTLGYNALMLAAQYDHQDVARVLIDAGANTGLLTSTSGSGAPVVIDSNTEKNNWSNVMVAAWYGDQEILSMFLAASLDHLNTPCDNKQMTPLHAAVTRGHCNTAAILIDAGATVDALDSDGKTPLHYAAGNGNYKCLMTLMHADADASIEDAMGNTAYTLAQAGDHHKIMTALSSSGYLLRFVARLFGAKA